MNYCLSIETGVGKVEVAVNGVALANGFPQSRAVATRESRWRWRWLVAGAPQAERLCKDDNHQQCSRILIKKMGVRLKGVVSVCVTTSL